MSFGQVGIWFVQVSILFVQGSISFVQVNILFIEDHISFIHSLERWLPYNTRALFRLAMHDLIAFYHALGLTEKDLVFALSKHGITLSVRHLRRILSSLNLSRRKHYTNIDEVVLFVADIVSSGQQHGYRWMYHKCITNGISVRKEDV